MLLGGEWRGEGWWMGGCDGRDSIYFLLLYAFFSAFSKDGVLGNPEGKCISAMTSPHQIDPSDINWRE